MPDQDKDKQTLVASLTSPSQRLIKIFIGERTEHPIQLQQQILENLSPFFAKALEDDKFLEGQTGTLRFPDDELDVWEVLLQWAFCRKVPQVLSDMDDETLDRYDLHLAVRCWTTGDKYGIEDFSDAVMLHILRMLDSMHWNEQNLDKQILQVAFERTVQGARLRVILVDWVVRYMYNIDPVPDPDIPDAIKEQRPQTMIQDLESLDGTGFFPELLAKKALYDKSGDEALSWGPHTEDQDDPRWNQFFVAYTGYGCDRIAPDP